jgi:phosphatidylglycerophosphate synthase
MVAAFIMMMKLEELKIPGWCVVVILAREFLVTGVRAIAAADGNLSLQTLGQTKNSLSDVLCLYISFISHSTKIFIRCSFPFFPPDRIQSFDPLLGNLSLIVIIFVSLYTLYSGTELLWKNWEN